MKVIALGVNSAFATGDFFQGLPYEQVRKKLKALAHEQGSGGKDVSLKKLLTELETMSEQLYRPKWQSNFLLEFETEDGGAYRIAIDFGSDYRHSLKSCGFNLNEVDAYYCSHPHDDHIGGVEGIALSHVFNPFFLEGKADWLKNPQTGEMDPVAKRLANGEHIPAEYKPTLYGHKSVLDELWAAARPGLETIQGVPEVSLETYFEVQYMQDNKPMRVQDGERYWNIYTVASVHVTAGYRHMPSYGLMLECSDGQVVFMPTDTQFMAPRQIKVHYEKADYVYQDCETGFRSDVHPFIDDLRTLPDNIKQKCYLYHYASEPEINEGEFAGILKQGETHEY